MDICTYGSAMIHVHMYMYIYMYIFIYTIYICVCPDEEKLLGTPHRNW